MEYSGLASSFDRIGKLEAAQRLRETSVPAKVTSRSSSLLSLRIINQLDPKRSILRNDWSHWKSSPEPTTGVIAVRHAYVERPASAESSASPGSRRNEKSSRVDGSCRSSWKESTTGGDTFPPGRTRPRDRADRCRLEARHLHGGGHRRSFAGQLQKSDTADTPFGSRPSTGYDSRPETSRQHSGP